ncbi:MAG: adenosine kinase [Citromicrobium sp.]|nr:adenosine kinase [Citromicrobium sp.]
MSEPKSDTKFDVIAIGNAIVDVIAPVTDAFLEAEELPKGTMRLIDAERSVDLYEKMGPAQEISGGAAANTLTGATMLGLKTAFIGQVANDQLGEIYRHDLTSVGVSFDTPARPYGDKDSEPPTGRCLVLVAPDGERTMNTSLGASQFLPAEAIDDDLIRQSRVLFLEGYLWDPEEPRAAMRRAIEVAREAGVKIAFATCADFCVHMHGKDFRKLIDDGLIDILFVNEEEAGILEGSDPDAALESLAKDVPLVVMTRGGDGAVATRGDERASVKPEPVAQVKDLTGAGDLFAAGFLSGYCRDASLEECLVRGAVAAGEVISHWGARPEADLKAMVAKRLG